MFELRANFIREIQTVFASHAIMIDGYREKDITDTSEMLGQEVGDANTV